MASYQYVYHMDGVSKTYPGGKKCFENIRLSFLPGVKIGVVGRERRGQVDAAAHHRGAGTRISTARPGPRKAPGSATSHRSRSSTRP